MSLVTTNIVMTYPVHWSKWTVMNNFIQNFYDALGPSRFASGFRLELTQEGLVLQAQEGFAKEWLFYLGASSKRGEAADQNAGYFGEGFKIAALTAFRDYGLGVRMESRDWVLTVKKTEGTIGGVGTSLLAYEEDKRPYREDSTLTLKCESAEILEEFAKVGQEERESFFYEGHPALGRCLYQGRGCAIYASAVEGRGSKGRLFARRQERARFSLPLIIRNDHYEPDRDDRDRKDFYPLDIRKSVQEVIEVLPPATAYEVLLCVSDYWRVPKDRYEKDVSWEELLQILCRNVSRDQEVGEGFRKSFPELIALPGKTHSLSERKMAREWFTYWAPTDRRLVLPCFHHWLAIPDLCEVCQEAGGFPTEREPSEKEERLLGILKEAAPVILEGICPLDESLPVKVILSRNSPVMGLAYGRVLSGRKEKNAYGLKVVRKALILCLRESLFARTFYEAFPVYGHELLHQFGSDGTKAFLKALQLMNRSLYQHQEELAAFAARWEEIR